MTANEPNNQEPDEEVDHLVRQLLGLDIYMTMEPGHTLDELGLEDFLRVGRMMVERRRKAEEEYAHMERLYGEEFRRAQRELWGGDADDEDDEDVDDEDDD